MHKSTADQLRSFDSAQSLQADHLGQIAVRSTLICTGAAGASDRVHCQTCKHVHHCAVASLLPRPRLHGLCHVDSYRCSTESDKCRTGSKPSPHGCNIKQDWLRRSLKGEAEQSGLDHEHASSNPFPLQGHSIEARLIWRVVEHLQPVCCCCQCATRKGAKSALSATVTCIDVVNRSLT